MLFALRTKHPINGVWRAVAGFMVMAYLHFAEQANREEIQAAEEQA